MWLRLFLGDVACRCLPEIAGFVFLSLLVLDIRAVGYLFLHNLDETLGSLRMSSGLADVAILPAHCPACVLLLALLGGFVDVIV